VADPEAGQVGYFGTICENGTPAILALPLWVKNGTVSEIETLVARDAKGAGRLEARRATPLLPEAIPLWVADRSLCHASNKSAALLDLNQPSCRGHFYHRLSAG
jgi:hypothetical protein